MSPHRRRREIAKREKTKKRPRRSREQRGKERLGGDSVAAVSEDVAARQQDGDAGKITGRIHPQRWKRTGGVAVVFLFSSLSEKENYNTIYVVDFRVSE